MIVLILYINLLNLSWIIKCLLLRNMVPLKYQSPLQQTTVFIFLIKLHLTVHEQTIHMNCQDLFSLKNNI